MLYTVGLQCTADCIVLALVQKITFRPTRPPPDVVVGVDLIYLYIDFTRLFLFFVSSATRRAH